MCAHKSVKFANSYDVLEQIVVERISLKIFWRAGFIYALGLNFATADDKTNIFTPEGKLLHEAVLRLHAGGEAMWPVLPLAFAELSPFSQKVLTILQNIPHGQTLTYGEVAAKAGSPKAARAVGRAVGANPWPLLVPCHRVLGASGDLHGFSSGGLPMKAMLLNLEGHKF